MSRKKREEPTDLHEESVVERLRREIATGSDGDMPIHEEDLTLLSLFSALPEEDRAVLNQPAADELLTNGENLEANLRERLIEGASRGLTHRRRQTQRLQVYLEYLRAESKITTQEIATQLEMTEGEVLAIERGERSLLELDPGLIANWVRRLQADVENVLVSLRQSLGLGQAGFSYSERERRLSVEDQTKAEEFLQRVESELTNKLD